MTIEVIGDSKNILKCVEDPKCTPDPRGLGVLFKERMEQYSNNIAEIEAETGRTSTYGEILLKSIRVAQHLQERNIEQNDIIILCSYNNMSTSSVLYAALFLGVRIAALDPSLPKYDIEYLLNLTRPRFIFSDESSSDILAELVKKLELNTEVVDFGENKKFIPFSNFVKPTGAEMNFQAKPVNSVNDTAIIYFSSGTTGFPKGVCCSHGALQSSQMEWSQECDPSICLSFSTFYWISGTMVVILAVLNGGARIVPSKGFNVDTAMHILSKYKVTYAILAQFYGSGLIQNYKSTDFDTSSIRTIHFVGGKLSEAQMVQLKELFPHSAVSNGYGMTEGCGCLCIYKTKTDRIYIDTKLGSCGRPMQGLTYKIVDIDTEAILGANRIGELRLKGILMNGYLNNPEATKAAYDECGFLKTGDLAYYDEDYCFYIAGRIKETIKYRGMIQSADVMEGALLEHAEIQEAVIIGKPDIDDGDHAVAFIKLVKGSQLTKEQIIKFYNEKIENHEPKKLRGGIYIVDDIPRTPTGKPRKMQLKDYLKNNN